MIICPERAVVLSFRLFCFRLDAVLGACAPLPVVGVLRRMWNAVVTVSDH